jgi:acetyl-CoA C-acetyltransferase/acetyl-CoA acyltransferase
MKEAVIVDAIRTPFGRRNGVYREVHPVRLLADTLTQLVRRSDLAPDSLDDVIAGCVVQAGEQAANVARQAILLAGLPDELPGVVLQRWCGSSQQATHFAAQAILAGDANYVVACGVESMTRVPMNLDINLGRMAGGYELLNAELNARRELVHQGESAERMAERWGLSRADLDAYSIESHARASAARAASRNSEIVPMPGVNGEGAPIVLHSDEGIRDSVDPARMATLEASFRPKGDGVITPGNSSQIADGAAALLIAERERALGDGLRPRARIVARVVAAGDPTLQLDSVIPATRMALARAGLSLQDIDWFEVNEAFASVPMAWAIELGVDPARLNPWGGAIAHGHPLGASGAALMAKVLVGLEASGKQFGLQTMCIGLGMATSTIIERI